jgi:hypothetical protein
VGAKAVRQLEEHTARSRRVHAVDVRKVDDHKTGELSRTRCVTATRPVANNATASSASSISATIANQTWLHPGSRVQQAPKFEAPAITITITITITTMISVTVVLLLTRVRIVVVVAAAASSLIFAVVVIRERSIEIEFETESSSGYGCSEGPFLLK